MLNERSNKHVSGVNQLEPDTQKERQEYIKPRLIRYGDVREVTLGVSGGTGETGNTNTMMN